MREMAGKACLAVVSAFAASAMRADTVALWPIECDPATKAFDGSSALAEGDGLSTHGDGTISGIPGIGWMLPPNPDASALMYEPANKTAVFGALGETAAANGMTLSCTSAHVVDHLYPTNDFTLEGWVAMKDYKSDNWSIFLQQSEGSSTGKGGWFVSFLGGEGARHFRLCAAVGSSNSEQDFANFTSAEELAFTNGWHHFALTFDYDTGSGSSQWTCWIDGVGKGTVTHPRMQPTGALGARKFFMGGRDASASNRFYGGFDYWRLSDRVLTPDQFLNQGGAGTPHPQHTDATVAYWKFDRRADGTLDATDSVGSADLSDGLYDVTPITGFFPGIVPSADQAFSGNPPNPTAALSSPNCGSFRSPGKSGNSDASKNGTVLVVPGLGGELVYANDFTVEGWLKPCWKTGVAQSGYLLGTRNSGENGWTLRVTAAGELYLFANDGGTGDVRSDAKVATLPSDWTDRWTHLALVYESTVGYGTWSIYADGVKLGSVANVRAAASDKCSSLFRLGGRENTDSNLSALYDCWRVSKAALEPDQFLCTTAGKTASSVIAYWPLDVRNGVAWDLRDEQENYAIRPMRDAKYHPIAVDDAPIVSNPDSTLAFDGNAAANSGSFEFRSPEGERSRAHLATSDNRLMSAISTIAGFTIEGYVKLTAAPSGTEYLLLTKTGAFSATDWSDHQIALVYGTGGFGIVDKKFSNFGNGVSGAFGTASVLSVGEWHHVALEYRGVESKNANNQTVLTSSWSLYVDGTLANTLTRATLGVVSLANPRWLVVGARPASTDGLVGRLDSWRVSSRCLEPREFLCAEGVRPAATEILTRAYWPLDSSDGSSVDMGTRVEPVGYSLLRLAAGKVSGSADRAASALPNAKTGLPSENVGSVALSGDSDAYARCTCLGRRLSLDQSFTVEGWVKGASGAADGVRQIAGTGKDGTGWCLLRETSGDTATFRIVARCGNACTPVANASFPKTLAKSRVTEWMHVALSYDHLTGHGVWRLRINGHDYGCVENAWRNGSFNGASDTFYLGNFGTVRHAGPSGNYDMWRVSSGLVEKDDLLLGKPGFALLFR